MNVALVFAGGIGTRMSRKTKPKQFLEISGKAIIIHTIAHFERHNDIDAIAVVCVKEWIPYLKDIIEKSGFKKIGWIIPGGDTALQSQYNGLKTIATGSNIGNDTIVLIHDGVRPLISEELITNCIECVRVNGSAVTIAPANETILITDANKTVKEALNRSLCCYARAPQCFYLSDILEVHEKAIKEGTHNFIDSATMLMYYGHPIFTVEGSSDNIKITTPTDYYLCKAIMGVMEDYEVLGL